MKNLVCSLLRIAQLRVAFAFVVFSVATLGSALTAKAEFVTLTGSNNPNLQAFLSISSLNNTSITFVLGNELVPGVTSTITSIGFDLPGIIPASTATCTGACNNFGGTPTVDNAPGNVPGFIANLDWALLTGPNFAGGNPPGINQGSTATFAVQGGFIGLSQSQFLNGAYVRFQSVSDPSNESTSDVAHAPAPVPSVPEPASVFLLGIGLLGVAAKRIRE